MTVTQLLVFFFFFSFDSINKKKGCRQPDIQIRLTNYLFIYIYIYAADEYGFFFMNLLMNMVVSEPKEMKN